MNLRAKGQILMTSSKLEQRMNFWQVESEGSGRIEPAGKLAQTLLEDTTAAEK